MIQPTRFKQFRNGDFVQFIQNVRDTVNSRDTVTLNIEDQIQALDTTFAALSDLYLQDRGNAVTADIEALDARRDAAIIGLNTHLVSYQKHYDTAKQEASLLLANTINKYGSRIYGLRYQEQTAVINSLIDEITSTAELITARDLLGLTDWFAELTNANRLFDEKYLERNEAYASAPKERMIDLRTQTEQAYRTLITHIEAYAVVSPSDAYTSLIDAVNTLVRSYNTATDGLAKPEVDTL